MAACRQDNKCGEEASFLKRPPLRLTSLAPNSTSLTSTMGFPTKILRYNNKPYYCCCFYLKYMCRLDISFFFNWRGMFIFVSFLFCSVWAFSSCYYFWLIYHHARPETTLWSIPTVGIWELFSASRHVHFVHTFKLYISWCYWIDARTQFLSFWFCLCLCLHLHGA